MSAWSKRLSPYPSQGSVLVSPALASPPKLEFCMRPAPVLGRAQSHA